MPKGRWQSIARIEMKWPYIDEYISDFKKAHVHSKQPLKGINWVQQFIEGLAGSVKRAMTNKFQTYEKAKKQASHIMRVQKLLHQVYKKRNNTWTNAQGQPQKTLWPTSPQKPNMCPHKKNKRNKRKCDKCNERQKRKKEEQKHMETPSMSLNSPTQQEATERIQMNRPSPSITNTITPSIDDLCTQLESLMLNEREEVINCLCVT